MHPEQRYQNPPPSPGPDTPAPGPGMADLLRQLGEDGVALIRQEIQLAKLEISEAASAMIADSVQILVALVIILLGSLILLVGVVLGLGVLLGGAYWAGALITAGTLLLIGALLAWRAMRDLEGRTMKPEATIEGLRGDSEWAREEMKELKRGLSK